MIDYEVLTAKIKSNLIKEGSHPDDIEFGKAKQSDLSYLTDLYGTYSYWSEFYRDDALETLKNYKVPESVIEFYSNYEPKWLPILNGDIRLSDLEGIKDLNSSGPPGVYLIKFGIIAFATTIGGHSICMDLNQLNNGEPRIIIVDHTFCSYNEYYDQIECVNGVDVIEEEYGDELIPLSYYVINKCWPEITATFSEFISKIANEEFSDIEDEFLYKD